MHRPVADSNNGPLGLCLSARSPWWRETHTTSRHDGFQPLDGIFPGSAPDVACPVVVVVSQQPTDLAVLRYSCGPVPLIPLKLMIALCLCKRRLLPTQSVEFLRILPIDGLPPSLACRSRARNSATFLSRSARAALAGAAGNGALRSVSMFPL